MFANLTEHFPRLEELAPPNTPVLAANGLTAFERLWKFAKARFGDKKLKFAFSIWSLDEAGQLPITAELSFDYDSEEAAAGALEQFSADVVLAAGRVFRAFQAHSSWIQADGTTKTAFAVGP